jgi:glyoxylase-like metal-dependent hydrolase (beta-lactamase superfamily II)
MSVKRVITGVHVVPMGMANAFLIEGDDGLTLIDAGYPGKEAAVFGAIRGLGRSPAQLKHLIFTHGHPDHIGSAAAIVQETGARTYMHPLRYPDGRERSFSAYEGGTWSVAASAMQTDLPSRRATGAGSHQPALDRRGNTAHRWRHRSYSYSWALCGTGRATLAPGTNAVRGRRVHEHPGPW